MQSSTQQIAPENSKGTYLAQYKNDVSAKQKLIRERLGVSSSGANITSTSSPDRCNIPSIDDEAVEQVTQERRYKGQFSYLDNNADDAEASLQFFKKNMQLPSSDHLRPATNLFERVGTNNQQASKPMTTTKTITMTTVDRSSRLPPLEQFLEPKTKVSSNDDKYQLGSGKPVPFKQNFLNETRQREPRAHLVESSSTPLKEFNSNNYHTRHGSSSSRVSAVEKPPNEQVKNLKSSSSGSHRSKTSARSKSVERSTSDETNTTDQPDNYQLRNSDSRSRQSIEDRNSAGSPSQSGTFTRKPLYNSLLRAHDSIRLKVNRPKVRPKSAVLVADTEIDDSIQLAEINPRSSDSNERAVDVKRGSSRRKKGKKKGSKEELPLDRSEDSSEMIPVRNFAEVRVVKVVRNETERSLGVTVRADDGNIVVARIMAGSLADKQGALQVGDIILSVNNREIYTPEQLQEELRKSINDDTVLLKIVPSFREELPTLCMYLRALFGYDANEDSLLPCKEVGVSFNQGDILEVVNQEDPNWWQARRVDSENLQTGLIPSQELEERRRAFVIPDYDLATRTSICGTRVSRKSKKKEIYNVGQNSDFDKAELPLYEEVCRTPAFERRTLVLIGANGVGKQALKTRLVTMDPERFGTPLPYTSRLPREGEEDGIHYHFVTRERMEEDIIDGKYLEYGEFDGALYGTKLDSIREIIGSGKVCVLDCSATCLKVLKTSDYLPFVAFIAAPTLDQLRYTQDWARVGNRNYSTLDRSLSRQSRRAKTLQDFAFDFFEDEDLQLTVEESARLFRVYENYFDIVLVNNNFERTFEQLKDAIDALSMAPQWIPISWIYGT